MFLHRPANPEERSLALTEPGFSPRAASTGQPDSNVRFPTAPTVSKDTVTKKVQNGSTTFNFVTPKRKDLVTIPRDAIGHMAHRPCSYSSTLTARDYLGDAAAGMVFVLTCVLLTGLFVL